MKSFKLLNTIGIAAMTLLMTASCESGNKEFGYDGETAGLRGALPAFGRHPECLGRHPARHTGREDHHADRLRILLAAEPAGGLPVRLHARHGSDGAFPRLLVRLVGRGRDDDRPHPAQRPQAPPGQLRQRFRQSGRRIKKISYLYANYAHKWTPKNNIRKSVNPK